MWDSDQLTTNSSSLLVLFEDPDTARQYTFSSLQTLSSQFGNGLRSRWAWQKGDVMAVYSPNCIDLPAVILGTLWAGGVISSVNPTYTVDELSRQLRDSGAKALVTHASCLANAIAAANNVGIPRNRVLLVGDERGDSAQALHLTELLNPAQTSQRVRINPAQDWAFLSYSSGEPSSLAHHGILLSCLFVSSQHQLNRYFGTAEGCDLVTLKYRFQHFPSHGPR